MRPLLFSYRDIIAFTISRKKCKNHGRIFFFFFLFVNSEAVQSVVNVVLKDLSKFTEKHMNGSLFFDEIATTFLKRKCSAGAFSVDFEKFLRSPIF